MTALGSPRLARRRRLLERQWPWFFSALVVSGAIAAFVVALDGGAFAAFEGFEAVVRGYTTPGVLLGVGAVSLAIASFAYALRKRALQESMPVGTLAGWLWGHVYLGGLAFVLALAHAGYGVISSVPSSGKALLLVLGVLVGSGFLWRFLYAAVPRMAATNVGNYSARSTHARAEACLVEIEKLAAGASPRFRELKAWVLPRTPSPAELAHAVATLPPEERAAFGELASLALSRLDALERERKQAGYVRLLQGLRVLHVPLGLLFVVLVPLHVLFAYDAPVRKLALGPATFGSALGGFEPSSSCAGCHADIYQAWRHSMHAHAMTSPIMIAQTNQVAARVLANVPSPDPKEACVACHGPIGTALTEGNTLPLPAGPLSDRALLDDGIGCAVCHQWRGTTHTGGAALTRFQAELEAGRTYYGPFGDAVGNAFHRSAKSDLFATPERLCQNCHSVELDKNHDGRIDRGTDLVLQTLFEEWELYAKGGGASCVDCHMPVVRGAKRAAPGATVPFEQDRDAPARSLRDHSFVGVDYPLDDPAARDALAGHRQALLASAGTLVIPPASVVKTADAIAFDAKLTNSGTGHVLPGGFAFVRQMWFEVTLTDANGRLLGSSGVLANPTDDLCDASIVDDATSPMRPLLAGCRAVDPQLVNFQQMLVDEVVAARDEHGVIRTGYRGERLLERAAGSRETAIQTLDAGPVPRTRRSTGKPVAPLPPGESTSFPYRFELTKGEIPKRVTVRLLFRVASPYFLRALGRDQPPGETPRLDALVGALIVTEMARATVEL
ncbi:MAG TPA: multiheme c-type cytochrome [Polyangiaceae bacterium]|nr:multiheme c-type cytochrome [Polyangiaceae bacterium]